LSEKNRNKNKDKAVIENTLIHIHYGADDTCLTIAEIKRSF